MSNEVFQQNLDDKKGPQPGGPYLIMGHISPIKKAPDIHIICPGVVYDLKGLSQDSPIFVNSKKFAIICTLIIPQ